MPLWEPIASICEMSRPGMVSKLSTKSSMGFAGLTDAVTSYPPEKPRESSNAAPIAPMMTLMTINVKTTSENMARVMPVRNLDASGNAIAVRMMGRRVGPRPNNPTPKLTR